MARPQLPELDDSLPGLSLSLNPSEDYEPSSTLQYVNSQLVAHGFARAPGLSIDGISNEDGQKLVKCLMAMLSQRMEDVGQTEQLGSKLRTISYEHERLQSLNKTEQEKAASAEREMTLFKSKLVASQRSHAAEVAAHKQTAAELQRARTALQYLRTTTQNEFKRKEKELERTLERWSKICDAQAKIGAAGAGLHCANLAAPCEQLVGKGMMEEALEQAEEARVELVKENEGFRSVLLGTAHALQTIAHNIKKQDQDTHPPEISLLTPTAVFAPPTSCLTHPENAHLKIKELITNLKDAVADAQQRDTVLGAEAIISDEEVTKMQQTIDSLRSELDVLRNNKSKAQVVYDQYTKYISGQKRERGLQETVNLMADTEDKRSKELEVERKKFTEATIRLGHERSELETERWRFLEEKRRWEADRILAELPTNPSGEDPDLIPSPKRNFKTKSASPKRQGAAESIIKSPKRSGVTRSPAKKKSKVTFKENEVSDNQRPKMKAKDKLLKEAESLHESEDKQVAQSISSLLLDPVETKKIHPEVLPVALESQIRRHPSRDCKPTMPLVLPTSFTLPPPSLGSSLSLQPLVIPISSSMTEFPPPDVPASSTPAPSASVSASGPSTSAAEPITSTPASTSTSSSSNFDKIPLIPSPPMIPSVPSRPIRSFLSPRTPRGLNSVGPNGMKKHDYSPAKPSPLSRILMIADSPSSSDDFMGTIEEEENDIKEETLKLGNPEKTKAIQLDFEADMNLPPVKTEAIGTHTNKSGPKDKKTRSESKTAIAEKENVGVISNQTSSTNHNATTAKAKAKETSNATAPKTKSRSSTTITKAETTSQSQMVKPGGARRVPLGTTGAGKVSSRLL